MTRDELRRRVRDLSIWRRGDERAPHKPLLLLWSLGRCAAGLERMVPYAQVGEQVKPLLEEFGPTRKSYHTEYPFWYLRNDGLWEVEGAAGAKVREGKSSQPTKGELLRVGAEGGLVPEAYDLLRSDPQLLYDVANQLVDAHFPDSIRDDVLAAVGLDSQEIAAPAEHEVVRRRKRDPRFREAVLIAYGYRCAVCHFDARIGRIPLAVEAAHIKWHQAGGPDRVPNGLGLCALHHKLFDRGGLHLERVGASSRVRDGGRWCGNGGMAPALRAESHPDATPVGGPPRPGLPGVASLRSVSNDFFIVRPLPTKDAELLGLSRYGLSAGR